MKDNCKLESLNKKFIDAGMGFERLVSILQKKTSNYDTDIFTPIIEIIENETNLEKYTGQIDNDIDFKDMSYRVLADHLRTIIISINDGCIPAPNGRNYIIRKILRRAFFYGNKLSSDVNFLSKVACNVITILSQSYALDSNKIINIIQDEELLFNKTLKNGKKLLNKHIKKVKNNILVGDIIFKLNTGAGLPLYIIEIICKEHKINIDYENYYKLIEQHKT
jgi:alanyl-tRNA synthetase